MGQPVAKILYGSQNYNLATLTSDRDYHIIEFPDVVDILKSHSLNRKLNEHESVWDVRNFFKYTMDAKFGALELLFSSEYDYYDEDFDKLIHTLRLYVGSIIRVNWRHFTRSLKGMAFSGVKKEPSLKMLNRFFYFYELWNAVHLRDGKLSDTCFSVFAENPYPECISQVSSEWDAEAKPLALLPDDLEVIEFLNKKIEEYFINHLKGDLDV